MVGRCSQCLIMENWKEGVTGEYVDGTLTLRDEKGGEETFEIGTNPEVYIYPYPSSQSTHTNYNFKDVKIYLVQSRQENSEANIRIAENKADTHLLYIGSLADTTGNAMKTELDKSITKEEDPVNVEGGKKKRRKNKKKTVRRLKKKRTTRKKF